MFGPASETSAFAPWQDTDIQAQSKTNFFSNKPTIYNTKYKSIYIENIK